MAPNPNVNVISIIDCVTIRPGLFRNAKCTFCVETKSIRLEFRARWFFSASPSYLNPQPDAAVLSGKIAYSDIMSDMGDKDYITFLDYFINSQDLRHVFGDRKDAEFNALHDIMDSIVLKRDQCDLWNLIQYEIDSYKFEVTFIAAPEKIFLSECSFLFGTNDIAPVVLDKANPNGKQKTLRSLISHCLTAGGLNIQKESYPERIVSSIC